MKFTLADFGWAPGGYLFKCVDCPAPMKAKDYRVGDKRAWRCEEHAQAMLDSVQSERGA